MDKTTFYEEIQQFPLKLRKLALFIAESKELMSLSKYSKAAGMSPNTTISMICKARRNGNDFNDILKQICKDKLIAYRPQVMKSVVREALKGSYRDADLYFRLIGDIRNHPKSEGNTTINSLTFVLPMPQHIDIQPAIAPEDTVIDVEPTVDIEE